MKCSYCVFRRIFHHFLRIFSFLFCNLEIKASTIKVILNPLEIFRHLTREHNHTYFGQRDSQITNEYHHVQYKRSFFSKKLQFLIHFNLSHQSIKILLKKISPNTKLNTLYSERSIFTAWFTYWMTHSFSTVWWLLCLLFILTRCELYFAISP